MSKITFSIFIVIILLVTPAFSHAGDEVEVIEPWEYLTPLLYLDNGEYLEALTIMVFWAGLILGLYTLFLMTVGRIFYER